MRKPPDKHTSGPRCMTMLSHNLQFNSHSQLKVVHKRDLIGVDSSLIRSEDEEEDWIPAFAGMTEGTRE